MSKFQLDWEIECDFALFGIRSHVGSHRLCFDLNRLFDWQLSYERMLEKLSKSRQTEHIVHRYMDENLGLDIALVLNRIPEGILASGASSFDYLLRVRQGVEDELDIIKTIRKSNLVTLVTSLDPENSGALDVMFELDKI
tara:strand:+ start:1138 stop:1557 length:420 start_codon:yes stop_codon:yes gene_type:complete